MILRGMSSPTQLLFAIGMQTLMLCNSYTPPTPKCKKFTCPAGQKALRKKGYKAWTYGCADAGANVFSMANFDPNDPLGGLNKGKKNFDKCCLEHDACQQTCGMSSDECHNSFQKCATKICKNDQNCMFQAQLGQMMSGPTWGDDSDVAKFDKDSDPACKGYNRWQSDSCECVDNDKVEETNDKRLKTFYKLYNPEKLDDSGEIKDLAEVKKKWKGKEPSMFLALTMKYKDKAIERRQKPKPKPYEPKDPVGDTASSSAESTDAGADADASDSESTTEDEADDAAEKKIESLKADKAAAVESEDFEKAQQIKDEIDSLKKEEVGRLKKAKEDAVAEEDFAKAKKLKARIEKLEL
eukprot:gnl/MRDRNA2_/MRDRNA2_89387_c0_seq1.p1 gnl/MRDRNA2_/MRDRNA2_89387_c0~~gnl/MRDRNA2_/MRDRNA2_89387_c0_seq1.p1  ORF type:complete len:354 (+),score=110.90 gnl/MRDRNA2_/MRDRNA2_89387_c0_seq1:67-1128(+)